MTKLVDLSGGIYGRLTVISRDGVMYGKVAWLCECSCGVKLRVCGADLKSGNKSSCGCLKVDVTRHKNLSHGMTNSEEYRIWCHMKERCLNPNSIGYSDYGGRGIGVCPRWRDSFESFYADMGPRPNPNHTIERINNNSGYSRGNCKWATRIEQARNKRNNRLVQYKDKDYTIAELAEMAGKSYMTIYKRIVKLNWPVELAIKL